MSFDSDLKSIAHGAAQRALNAGGTLRPMASSFYSGGHVYAHTLTTVGGKRYRVAQVVARALVVPPPRSALQCAARACPGCTVCNTDNPR